MKNDWPITRRACLAQVARSGGAGAALAALDVLGGMSLAIGAEHKYPGPPKVPAGHGKGKKVTIIGAGMAGLISALELGKAGFHCTIIEARARPGGRNWTIRGGDRITQSDGTQQVHWPKAPHLYFNAGPARIPHHHHAILGYCRDFKVPLEIMMNDNRAALFQDDKAFGGKPMQAKQVINDGRGYFAELLAKAGASGGLDKELSKEDLERLKELVGAFGDLQPSGKYTGGERAGFTDDPGEALKFGELRKPLPFKELMKADFLEFKAHFGEGFDQASTMLQPVGGMDQIPKAIARQLTKVIRYETVVDEIRKTANGAKVVCHRGNGPKMTIESDFVICTLPLSVLRKVPNDLAPEYQKAMAECAYSTASKIAFYAPRRFWEEDDDIYGGMSWTSREITQILYPSHGLRQKDGVLVGSYCFGIFPGDDMSKFSVQERLKKAIASGEIMHPGYEKMVRDGVSVAWPNVPFNDGAWALWTPEQRAGAYRTLLEPDGAIFLAGEHLSNLMSWQEGAILSAHRAIEKIAARVHA
jgi:monoamine oxidase